MVLESLEPKENDTILKNFFFFKIFGGFEPPQNPLFRFLVGLGIFFPKYYHFLWALNFPEPSLYLIFNIRKYF